MTEVFNYRKLAVYQKAKLWVKDVYKLIDTFPPEEKYALCNQIQGAEIAET